MSDRPRSPKQQQQDDVGCCWSGKQLSYALKLAVGGLLSMVSLLAILSLMLLPSIPEPGDVSRAELCIDLGGFPPVRFDHSRVKAGPCFGFDITFMAPPTAP